MLLKFYNVYGITRGQWVNTLRPRQNGRHFPDDIFNCIFLNENVCILIKISLKFVPKGPIINIPALVQIIAWHRPGDKPLSEWMMASLLTHICGTRPQWVKMIPDPGRWNQNWYNNDTNFHHTPMLSAVHIHEGLFIVNTWLNHAAKSYFSVSFNNWLRLWVHPTAKLCTLPLTHWGWVTHMCR